MPKQGTAIIQIDIDPLEIGRNYAGRHRHAGRCARGAGSAGGGGATPQNAMTGSRTRRRSSMSGARRPRKRAPPTSTAAARAHLPRTDRAAAQGRDPHSPIPAMPRLWTGTLRLSAPPDPALFPRRRIAGLVLPRFARRQVRGARQAGHLLLRRRRLLLSSAGARNRAPPRHQDRDRHQQQSLPVAGTAQPEHRLQGRSDESRKGECYEYRDTDFAQRRAVVRLLRSRPSRSRRTSARHSKRRWRPICRR